MSYQRQIPRDLFNEASLLKCLGRLYLKTEIYIPGFVMMHTGAEFQIMQDEADGSIRCSSICIMIGTHAYNHHRPLNSREDWPLYLRLRADPDADEFAAFDENGDLSTELLLLLGSPA